MSTQTSATAQKSAAPALTAAPAASLQRQCDCGQHALGGECDDCRQRRGALSRGASRIGTLHSPGQPLDRGTRLFMESRFVQDFSMVRVHTDSAAAESARVLHAHAWTLGSHLVFAAGAYSPHTPRGRHLLAHELAHVVQQRRSSIAPAQTPIAVSEPGDAAEREAEAAAGQVADGKPARVDAVAPPNVVHRDGWDTVKEVGEVGGVLAGVAAAIRWGPKALKWLLSRFDSSDVEHPPACGAKQLGKIQPALTRARKWNEMTLTHLQAFRSQPDAPENSTVKDSLNRRFRAATPQIAEKVERVLAQVQRKIAAPKLECHNENSDSHCSGADAHALAGRNVIAFCPTYYERDDATKSGVIIHETTHTLLGGEHIGDRGYQGERILGSENEPARLTTDEALSNAESYAEFVAEVASGRAFGKPAQPDEIDCPADWQELVKDSIARAERAVISMDQDVRLMDSQRWHARWTNLKLPGGAPDFDRARQIFRKTRDKVGSRIHFVCRPYLRECAKGDLEWSDDPPTFTLCAGWKTKPEAERILQLVAGLFGLYADAIEDDRRNLAAVALAAVEPTPKHDAVFGSAAWSPDLITISYFPLIPRPGRTNYQESGTLHQRLSDELPVYRAPSCGKTQLPFKFMPMFTVDAPDKQRAAPITPPYVSLEYKFPKDHPVEQKKEEDNDTTMNSAGAPLGSKLHLPVALQLQTNGVLEIEMHLDDPDAGVHRKYHDEINVEADHPCDAPGTAPAGSGGK